MPYQNYRKNYKKNYGNLQKKKWASLMRDVPLTTVVIDPTATGGSYATMVLNAAETATPTPTILKVKYPKISVDFAFDATLLNNGFACIMYVPQGVVINSGLPVLHPEWIMAWRNACVPKIIKSFFVIPFIVIIYLNILKRTAEANKYLVRIFLRI